MNRFFLGPANDQISGSKPVTLQPPIPQISERNFQVLSGAGEAALHVASRTGLPKAELGSKTPSHVFLMRT